MSFYSEEELFTLGLKSYGRNVKISRHARLYNPSSIEIGSDVRIDDFCILSASTSKFIIRDYVHISAGVYIYGSSGIIIDSFSNISAGAKLYTVNDDYSGEHLVGPMVSDSYRNVDKKSIYIGKYCVVGCNTVLLPGAILEEGVAVGCNSLVKQRLTCWSIYVGTPTRYLKPRSKNLLKHVDDININVV